MPTISKKVQVNKNPKIHGRQAQWSHKQKFNAVVTFLLVGNLPATAAATGVPLWTLKKWKASTWWKTMEDEARISRNLQVSSKVGKITEKALKALEDRIDNGDIYYDTKRGEVRRVPVNARTLSNITKDTIDRQVLLEKLIREEPAKETQDDIKTRLENLMDEFRKFARKPRSDKGRTIDAEIIRETEEVEGHPQALEAPLQGVVEGDKADVLGSEQVTANAV